MLAEGHRGVRDRQAGESVVLRLNNPINHRLRRHEPRLRSGARDRRLHPFDRRRCLLVYYG